MSDGKTRRAFEVGLNVVTLLAVVTFLVSVAGYLRPDPSGARAGAKLGSALSLPEAKLAPGKKTVLIALQAECPYCEQSMAFYRELVSSLSADSFQVVGIVPHAASAGLEMFTAANVPVREVVKADFARLRINATPTVMFVDGQRILRSVWIGKLSASTEDAVFKRLGIVRRSLVRNPVEAKRLGAVVANVVGRKIVIDARDRGSYGEGRLQGALNIPLDEMYTRMPHEVPSSMPVVLYCRYEPTCPVVFDNAEAESTCDRAMGLAGRLGFKDVLLVTDALSDLEAAGARLDRGR